MKIFEVCKAITLKKGRRVEAFDMTVHAIYDDPFGCGLRIDYGKVGASELVDVYFGGREVFYYHDGGLFDHEGWYIVSGEWENLVENIYNDTYQAKAENSDLIIRCKIEAEANRDLLEQYRKKCLILISESRRLPKGEIAKELVKVVSGRDDKLVVELQENKMWCVMRVYYDCELVFWYRWNSSGHKLYNKGRLMPGSWMNLI